MAFLSVGSAIKTTATISKKATNYKIITPDKMLADTLPIGTLGRIKAEQKSVYTVWLLEERASNTVQIEVPLQFMGQLFAMSSHRTFA